MAVAPVILILVALVARIPYAAGCNVNSVIALRHE
jgi:hypothetical protein